MHGLLGWIPKRKTKLKTIEITLCEACLKGIGEVCRTPGCAFCWNRPPDIKVDPLFYELIEEWEENYGQMKKSGPGKVRLTIFVCNPCKHLNSSSVKRKEESLDIHSCGHSDCKNKPLLPASKSKIVDTPDWCPYLNDAKK